MLDKIVKLITERLAIRETTRISISQEEMLSNRDSLFLKAKTVRIKGVDKTFLDTLIDGSNDEKQQWFCLAKSYGVEIELELFDIGEPWLCYEQLVKIPYPIFSSDGNRLVHVLGKVICYKDIALIDSESLLCKYKSQLTTSLASEYIQKQQIAVRERE